MKKFSIHSMLLIMVVFVAVPGCAWLRKSQPQPKPAPATVVEDTMINIEAGSYSLKPDRIRLEKPGQFILQVNNLTGSEQEFVLKDPQGKELKNLHVGSKSTSISNVDLPAPGIYDFRSTKLLRSPLGKKVRIEVGQAK